MVASGSLSRIALRSRRREKIKSAAPSAHGAELQDRLHVPLAVHPGEHEAFVGIEVLLGEEGDRSMLRIGTLVRGMDFAAFSRLRALDGRNEAFLRVLVEAVEGEHLPRRHCVIWPRRERFSLWSSLVGEGPRRALDGPPMGIGGPGLDAGSFWSTAFTHPPQLVETVGEISAVSNSERRISRLISRRHPRRRRDPGPASPADPFPRRGGFPGP